MSIFDSISNGFRALSDPFIGQGNAEENRMIREEKAKIKKLSQQIEEQYLILGKTYYNVKAETDGLEQDEAAAYLEIVEAEAVNDEADGIAAEDDSNTAGTVFEESVSGEKVSEDMLPEECAAFTTYPEGSSVNPEGEDSGPSDLSEHKFSEETCPEDSVCTLNSSEDPTVSEIKNKISELLKERKDCSKRISEIEESIRTRKEEEAALREQQLAEEAARKEAMRQQKLERERMASATPVNTAYPAMGQNMRRCLNCGTYVNENSNFCTQCGSKLNFCPNCGALYRDEARFCVQCGFNLGQKSTAVETVSEAVSEATVEAPVETVREAVSEATVEAPVETVSEAVPDAAVETAAEEAAETATETAVETADDAVAEELKEESSN